ncbi:MAG: tyrosine-type recombinase/integrase [Gammaproteobacteria bacterium]|nr:tyrosine-type recombinase/integrase [Gammaproteobacteria bacterium]
MFEKLNKRLFYRKIHLEAPLLRERIAYLRNLEKRKRSYHYLKVVATYLLLVVQHLDLKENKQVPITEIDKAADGWIKHKYKHPRKNIASAKYLKSLFVMFATKWLTDIGRLKYPSEVGILYKLYSRYHFLHKHLTAPMLQERLKYLQYWKDNGAIPLTLKRISAYLLLIIDYLNLENKKIVTVAEIEKAAEKWAIAENQHWRKPGEYSKFAKQRFIADATRWLKMINRLEEVKPEEIKFVKELSGYINYMRHEQGLSERTILSRDFHLKNFLTLVSKVTDKLNKLDCLMIDGIIEHKQKIDNYARVSIQDYTSIIRSFIRYAEHKKWCRRGLAASIKTSRVYKHASLPYGPSWEDVKKVLAKTEGKHPTSIRDRAIIMLLAVYGLRCSEVVNLKLDNLDWKNELLHITRAKEGKPQLFPLSKTVGNAILRYIREVRQNNCCQRNVFICRRAPFRPLSTAGVYMIVKSRWHGLNVQLKHYGPHSLRHACATHLINEGVSLKEISDHLGHQSLETTRIYAKVNLTELRKIADFDIGGLL